MGVLNEIFLCRRVNPETPGNKYLVAGYTCLEGFKLQNPEVNRLYCSDSRWIGTEPLCTPQGRTDFILLKFKIKLHSINSSMEKFKSPIKKSEFN